MSGGMEDEAKSRLAKVKIRPFHSQFASEHVVPIHSWFSRAFRAIMMQIEKQANRTKLPSSMRRNINTFETAPYVNAKDSKISSVADKVKKEKDTMK